MSFSSAPIYDYMAWRLDTGTASSYESQSVADTPQPCSLIMKEELRTCALLCVALPRSNRSGYASCNDEFARIGKAAVRMTW